MIEREGYYYYLKHDSEILNTLKWSMAGGGVRILTSISSDVGISKLIEAFITDCQKEKRTILPLSVRAQNYFKDHEEKNFILKSLDVEFLKENFGN